MYELHWTEIDLPGRSPPETRCCGLCNPAQLAQFRPSSARDHRLRQFAAEFIDPIAEEEDPDPRPTSPSSSDSDDSTDTVDFEPLAKGQAVSKADKDRLRARLIAWRILRHKKRGSSKFISAEVALPPRTLETLVTSSGKFLSDAVIGKKQILAVVKYWDFGTDEDFRDVAEIICDWRSIFANSATPKSQHRTHKRTRAGSASVPAPPQPNFTPTRPPLTTQNRTRVSDNDSTPRRPQINSVSSPRAPRTPHSTRNSVPDDIFSSPAAPSPRIETTRRAEMQSIPRTAPRTSTTQYPPYLAHPVSSPAYYTTPFRPTSHPQPLQTTPIPLSAHYRPHINNQTPQPTTYHHHYSATPPNLIPSRPNYAQVWPTNTPARSMSPYTSPLYYPPSYIPAPSYYVPPPTSLYTSSTPSNTKPPGPS